MQDHIGFVSTLRTNALKGLANNKASENQFELHEEDFLCIVFHKKRPFFQIISKNQKEMKTLSSFFIVGITMSYHVLSVFALLFCWDFHTIFYNKNFIYRFCKEAFKSLKMISECHLP